MDHLELRPAARDDWPCLENLMQFYLYELSQWLPLKFAAQGLYALQALDDYWRHPATHPWLILVAGELAGFAVVDQQRCDHNARRNLGYLFIARRFRRLGIGRQVTQQLFEHFKGSWQVMHFDANLPARDFWRAMLAGQAPTPIIAQGYPASLYRWPD
ncbi:GNAT family N-acetyltransferase [Pseudomonas chlororaphis]|uniref:GNAT family N-acetyltransferase n=1 Tax=Pseudomonas chlororaphis TaxID=587753 RepID=UPI00209B27C9|nr:GNAT family N-acetyltransferase [Pseudomonas chlororaphis]MCO7573710.1 GNAT family N-acetyltransferase [Pseudomonas chlororaphis]MCO7592058.1 GNAT family N-acetyltransferase [Pseudomonas chlororaphis]